METDDINAVVSAFKELYAASLEYIEYEHSGDLWEEDARAMGEMSLDDLKRSGRFDEYADILKRLELNEEQEIS